MAENEVVRTIRVRGVPEGLESLTSQLQRAEKAYAGVGTAASTAGSATETSARKLNTTERAYRSLTERLDSTARVYRQLQSDTRTLSGAFDAGFMGKGAEAASRFNRELLQIRQTLQDVGGRAATGSSALEQTLGLRTGGQGAARESAAAFEAEAQRVRKLRAEIDPLSEAIRANSERIETYSKALARGEITSRQFEMGVARSNKTFDDTKRAIDGTNVAMGKYATGAGLARHELVNLSRQAQDVFVSLASGQAPLTVLIQQGTQIADIFTTSKGSLGGFFGQLIAGAGRFATSLAGITTGAVAFGAGLAAAGYRWSESQREIELSLMGIGRGSGQTVASINKIADAAADAGKISASSARQIASIFAGTGQIDSSLIGSNLVDNLSRGYGVLTSKSQKDAAADLASALASPTAGAQELEKRLGKLSDAQMEFIRNAEASGNKLEAQRALLSAINEPLSVAANRVGFFAKAWEAVAKAASNAADAVGQAVSGPTLDRQIADLQRSIEARVRRGQNPYGLNVGSSRSVIAREEAELAPLLRAQRRNREAAEYARADAASSNLSRQAGGVTRGITTDLSRRMALEEQLSVLEKAFGDSSAMKKLGPTADLVSGAIEKLRSSLANFETEAERIARDFQIQAQAIDAYTLEQKAAVEAERARIEAIRAGRGEVQAGVEAEQARTRTIMEANRQLRDTARDLKDAGSLIGLSPFQRSLRENENTSRRERETLTMGGAAANSNGPLSRDQVLDLIAKYESNNRNIHQNIVPEGGGYNPSVGRVTGPSSAQGFFQITNPTWRDGARFAGVDLGQYPNAMSAPYDVQRQVAGALYDKRGVSPWAPYNANLRGALAGQGVAGANDNSAARNANTIREAYEGWNAPLTAANRQLDQQIALQQRAQQTYAMSTAEITAAAEKQKLLNEYAQQGIPITDDLSKGIDEYARRAGMAAQANENFAKSLEAMRTVGDLGRDMIKGIYSDLRNGASGAEIFRNALDRIASKLLDMALNDLFGKAFGNNSMGLFGNGGGGGFLGGLANFFSGGGGGLGTTPGAGGLYAVGGYTGTGGKYDPAGVVHRNEYVFSSDSVNRLGVGYLDSLHRSSLKGYAAGGYVSPTPYSHAPANQNTPGLKVDIHNNVSDQANVRVARGRDGSLRVVIDAIKGDIAEGIVRKQGPISQAIQATDDNRQLWG